MDKTPCQHEFENSDFIYMLSQAAGDRQILAKQLGISPHQLSYVTHSNAGEVTYPWLILHASLAARPFTDVTLPLIDSAKMETYNLLMQTKGYRQYLSNPLDSNWLPHISDCYGYRVHPTSGAKDCHRGLYISADERFHLRDGGAVELD